MGKGMRESESRFGGLAGTLCEPENGNSAPLVLMLHGSGPLDRNENGAGQQLNIFDALAMFLADRGYASFRYDKRGCGESAGVFLEADQSDFVSDAAACLDGLERKFPNRFSSRYLLGHSEGTAVAARLSLERQVDGLVLLCPYVQDMETILMEQAAQLDRALDEAGGLSGKLNRAIAGLLGRPSKWQTRLIGRIKSSSRPTIRYLGRRLAAGWLRECMNQDLPALYRRVQTPAYVLGGAKDIQCNPEDVARIGEIMGPAAETEIIADMTHILRLDPDPPSFNTYRRQMGQPVAPEVPERIADWLDRRVVPAGG